MPCAKCVAPSWSLCAHVSVVVLPALRTIPPPFASWACSFSYSFALESNSSTLRSALGVFSNSATRLRSVASPTWTTATTSRLLRSNWCSSAATQSAAPHTPDGRRPVCIQSRFMLATSRRAVFATACIFRPRLSLSAKRWMNREGSIGLLTSGCCSRRRRRHSCRNTAPRTYTFVCTTSLKSMSMYGRDSCLHTMYRHAPATCCVRRPRVKFRCTASLYSLCAALVMSSRGRMPRRSATCEISCLPLLIVFSCESTWRPKMRPPLAPRPTPAETPLSGTKLPST